MRRLTMLLAAGLLVIATVGLPSIRAGAQSSTVTDDNLSQSIANAKSAADLEAVAAYYDQEAADAKKKAALHLQSASNAKPVGMANMCHSLAKYWDKVAAQDTVLADAYRKMAKAAGSGS